MINTNGSSTLPHIKEIWDRTWSVRRLLDHVHEDIFGNPTFVYVNKDLVRIAKLWSQDILEERKLEEEMRALEEEAAQEKQRQTEENTASIVASLRSGASVASAISQDNTKTSDVGEIPITAPAEATAGFTIPEQKEIIDAHSSGEEAAPAQVLESEDLPQSVPEPVPEVIEWFDREELLDTFPRVEQMHVNVLALFLTDEKRYQETILDYVNKYAILIPPEPEVTSEIGASADMAGGPVAIEYMGDDYFYDPDEEDPQEIEEAPIMNGNGVDIPHDLEGYLEDAGEEIIFHSYREKQDFQN
jgi:DNA-binding protein H-NS